MRAAQALVQLLRAHGAARLREGLGDDDALRGEPTAARDDPLREAGPDGPDRR
jgi:hypothetical protein